MKTEEQLAAELINAFREEMTAYKIALCNSRTEDTRNREGSDNHRIAKANRVRLDASKAYQEKIQEKHLNG